MRIDKPNEISSEIGVKAASPAKKKVEDVGIKKSANGEKNLEYGTRIKTNEPNELNKADEADVIKAIEAANKSVKMYDRRLEYSIHEATHQIMIKVIDTSSPDEVVIREIPSEKILDMVAKMWELSGLFVDEKA